MTSLQETFKNVMAHVATPVAVATSMDGGLPVGTTVSAFLSLSMNPPMVLVSLDRGSETLELVTESRKFGLNILSSDQHSAALKFATKNGLGKFHGVRWDIDHDLPRITGAAGWVACTVERILEGGDHMIVLGTVVAAEQRDSDPLTYHRRTFGTHCALEMV
ncbi:NADH-FMN oxidoreductase [Rhodococcus aetherivorans]|uniref:NADH-FMN oxidoreductase n=2 Tax=Rhodococcus aetherivorans TaxID=191292 RepID=A0ABQ0YF65_9NOCA|nr:flavin reductase domain protein FMN-binding protein [Rhodococcus rhodochrous ATCC 21198]KDE10237.1 flavin reductase [Rhodococcus aetherivorans]GES35186.1 NADH-FMN oxidoreductase [Rhodococcus aetherivorans]CCW10309.1 NADH-FMN oxidoreductase [Rhodococcus aetherivorans]